MILMASMLSGVIAGCVNQEPEPAAPRPAGILSPAEIPSISRSDETIRKVSALALTDLPGAIELAEEGVRRNDQDEAAVRLLLLLGRLHRRYEDEALQSRVSDEQSARYETFQSFASSRPELYDDDEMGEEYRYNGLHFRTIVQRFPRSGLADDAAYELTALRPPGECEGLVDCGITQELTQLAEFLRKYPSSEFASQAVERANAAFLVHLNSDASVGVTDPSVRKLLGQYDQVAGLLPPHPRARAYEVLGLLYDRMGNHQRTRYLYGAILREIPDYENIEEIRARLDRIES